jgi:hypothetical protein
VIDGLNQEVIALKQERLSTEQENTQIDVPLVERYMSQFVSLFMNVDLSKDEKAQERLKKLESFLAFDVNNLNDKLPKTTSRKLLSYKLLNLQSFKKYELAKYQVEFEITETTTDDKGQEKTVKKKDTSVLCIPFVESEGLVSIVSLPYFTSETSIYGKAKALEAMEDPDTSEAIAEHRKSIEEYLPVFFTKYAQSDPNDLALLMKKVELMGGNFELVEVDLANARYSFLGENVLVQVAVTFNNKETEFIHTEAFTLQLEKQANSWFVLDMQHVFNK